MGVVYLHAGSNAVISTVFSMKSQLSNVDIVDVYYSSLKSWNIAGYIPQRLHSYNADSSTPSHTERLHTKNADSSGLSLQRIQQAQASRLSPPTPSAISTTSYAQQTLHSGSRSSRFWFKWASRRTTSLPQGFFLCVSRAETHTKILQQVILFVAEDNFTNYTDFAQFLRSLLTYTMIQNSVSTAYTCFAQRLHTLLETES